MAGAIRSNTRGNDVVAHTVENILKQKIRKRNSAKKNAE